MADRELTAPPIERYIRCSVTRGAWTVEPGIEWREGDDFDAVTEVLAGIAGIIAGRAAQMGPMDAARFMEHAIASSCDPWHGRAFFVEVHDAKYERWTQTYQPYGMPRAR